MSVLELEGLQASRKVAACVYSRMERERALDGMCEVLGSHDGQWDTASKRSESKLNCGVHLRGELLLEAVKVGVRNYSVRVVAVSYNERDVARLGEQISTVIQKDKYNVLGQVECHNVLIHKPAR